MTANHTPATPTMLTRNSFLPHTICLLALMLLASVSQGQVMYRILKKTSTTLSNGQGIAVLAGECYPLIGSEESGAILKLKFGGYTFYVPRSACSLIPESEIAAATTRYDADYASFLPHIREYEEKQAQQSKALSSSSSPPQAASPPPVITVEPTFYWNVEVVVGRKYAWTADTYERYKTITTEVQAKSKSEAEAIAARQTYTTNSNLIQSKITVEPAGTKNAKFRVKSCTATRQ
jgi:hypothetical protein